MPVAKSYESLEIQGEPFEENGRMYVNVKTNKSIKKVRWYSETEYARMYPDAPKKDIMDFDARHAFGFGPKGYITLYKGKIEELIENVGWRNFRYNCTFLYYTPSELTVPELPSDVIPVKLTWEEVQDHDNRMKSHEEVGRYVSQLLVMDVDSTSEYQGVQGSWITKTVTVREKKDKDSRFGTKHTYTLEDAENNYYVWETDTKDYSNSTTVSLKMKVKEHKEIDGVKTTVVWYCKEM